jgi:UDP-glucose 4-epimerase
MSVMPVQKLGIRKIIFTSSVAVYGFAPVGTNESGAINYFNDYGHTKWLAKEKYRAWLKHITFSIIERTD